MNDPGWYGIEASVQLLRIRGNWWSKCQSVENSHGLFAVFSDNYYPKPLGGANKGWLYFQILMKIGGFHVLRSSTL